MPGKTSDPQWRKERARKAAAARHSDLGLVKQLDARVDQWTPAQREAIKDLVDRAPAFSLEKERRLIAIFAPGGEAA